MYCARCDRPLYEGDEYYEVNDAIFCEDCIYECHRTAERNRDGTAVISYGEKWEE